MMKIFFTDSTQHLRRSLKKRGYDIGWIKYYTFADGEHGYRLRDEVQRRSVGIIASILPNPKSLFDLMALYHLVRENGARKTIFIIPYLGYSRQDRRSQPGERSIGVMVVDLLQKINPSRLVLLDVHSDRIRNAFGPRVTELSALPLFAETLKNDPPDIIISPDAGFISKAKELANMLKSGTEVAWIEKVRPRPNVVIAKRIHGDVEGGKVLIIDDMIDTGSTISEAVKLISKDGPTAIRIAATHGIFSRKARELLSGLSIKEILVTNTLSQRRYKKIRILSIVSLLLS